MGIKIGDVDSGRDTNVASGDLATHNVEMIQVFDAEALAAKMDQAIRKRAEPKQLQRILQEIVDIMPEAIELVMALFAPRFRAIGMIVGKLGSKVLVSRIKQE